MASLACQTPSVYAWVGFDFGPRLDRHPAANVLVGLQCLMDLAAATGIHGFEPLIADALTLARESSSGSGDSRAGSDSDASLDLPPRVGECKWTVRSDSEGSLHLSDRSDEPGEAGLHFEHGSSDDDPDGGTNVESSWAHMHDQTYVNRKAMK